MGELDPVKRLRLRCRAIKLSFLGMYWEADAGHVGSSLSCAEILTFARFGLMKDGDDLVLSKGHAAAALYATLAEAGDIPASALETFYRDGTLLAAHPPPNRLPGIPFATGSLGHGLSLAAGMALARKRRGTPGTVFCVGSDGELDAGSTWEAILFAAQHRLDNLVWLIDRNGLQGFGRTEEVLGLEPLADKLRAFGVAIAEADGHDFASLFEAAGRVPPGGKLRALVCRTIKGAGMGKRADTVGCHYTPLDEREYRELVTELGHA